VRIAVAKYLDGLADLNVLAWSHPPNEAKHAVQYRMKQKRAGMKTGEPDCIIYLKGGQTVFIELKRLNGTLSAEQKNRHGALINLGFVVNTIKAATPAQAVKAVAAFLRMHGVREAQ
jgi:hypothetical protein